jgi:hypothetical protein
MLAFDKFGSPIKPDQINAFVSSKVPIKSNSSSSVEWDAVTQQQHPHLSCPCWMVHPCKTEDVLSAARRGYKLDLDAYVACWLSVVGPMVGVSVDPRLVATPPKTS